MIEIRCREIDAAMSPAEMARRAARLAPERRGRFDALQRVTDRVRLLTGTEMVREALAEISGIPARDIRFRYNAYGKPYPSDVAGVFFNISHAGRYMVAAFSDSEVGIDIEERTPLEDMDAAARVFMSDAELVPFMALEPSSRSDRFFRIWTAKESYIKHTGRGIYEGLQSITIDTEANPMRVLRESGARPAARIHGIALDEGYAMCVCTESPEMPILIR